MSERRTAGGVLVLTALAGLVAVLRVGPPLQPLVVGAFLLVAPGAALLLGVRLETVALRITAVVSTSLAVDVLLATALFYAGVWTPLVVGVALGALTTALSLAALVRAGRVTP